jgi:hypothetical protein
MFAKINSKVKEKTSQYKTKAALAIGSFALITSPAAAATNETELINTTAILGMIDAFTGIFPALGNMLSAALPLILLITFVGFVLK